MFIVSERRALDERLQGRLAVALSAVVRALGIVPFHPFIDVRLKLLERVIELAPEGAGVELVLDRLMKALADPIRLRALGPGARGDPLTACCMCAFRAWALPR